jgi:hypothetical protein
MTLIEYIGAIPYYTLVAMLLSVSVPWILSNVSSTYQEVFAQLKEIGRIRGK